MPTWTPEQEQAIKSREANLLVSAAAGSGKTAVLVQRIVDLVLIDQVDIDRMLIVTFTNAAAAEMKERIARELIKRTKETPGLTEKIRRQTALLNRSFIMTMHSFCLQLLKTHFHLIGLDPAFRIGNETEVALLKQEALEETLEDFYEEAHPDFHELIESFCSIKSDQWLETNALRVYHFIQSQPNPEEWLDNQLAAFHMDEKEFRNSAWMKSFMSIIEIRMEGVLNHLLKARDYSRKPGGPEMYGPTIEKEIAALKAILADINNHDFAAFTKIKNMAFGRLKPAKKVDETLKTLAQSHRNGVKDELKKIQKEWFFSPHENWLADIKRMRNPIEQFCRFIKGFTQRYNAKKRKRNIVDFNDLEHLALEVLSFPEANTYYRQQFVQIFIDEYQDSNRVQETIINHIQQSNNLFMVGDVKQSIYRFRLAEPEIFLKKQRLYSHDEKAVNRRIDLNQNFRSRNTILEGVNFIFEKVMSPYLGEMEYDSHAALKSGEVYPAALPEEPIQVHLLEKTVEDDDALLGPLEELTDMEMEVELVVDRIKELMKERIYDETLKTTRPMKYRDIVVLMRATKKYQQTYQDIFTAAGIPLFTDAGTGFFDTLEIQIFINLLKIIDNFKQDVALLSVLRSPIGHFTVNELAEIRLTCPSKAFHTSFVTYGETRSTALAEKVVAFIKQVEQWRNRKDMPLFEYVWWLFTESGYYSFVSVMPGGEQRQANLRMLAKRAYEYESIQNGSIYGYLHYIEKLSTGKSGDMGVAKLISPNADVVRVMSIHKSKGLEFPVVILAGINRKFNVRDTYEKLLVHKDLGFGPICAEPDKRIFRNTLSRAVIKEKLKQESLSEEMRILYVAMTRPKQKLLLVGSVNKALEKWEKWGDALSAYQLSKGQSYLDWIGPALASAYKNHADTLEITSPAWTIKAWSKEALATERVKAAEGEDTLEYKLRNNPESLTGNQQKYVAEQLEWTYPYQKMTETPVKYTVTELLSEHLSTKDHSFENQVSLQKTPRFMLDKAAHTPAERGSVIHYVIQHLQLDQYHNTHNLGMQLDAMVEKEMLTEEERDLIDKKQMEDFLESALGHRMRLAQPLYREWPFVLQKERDNGHILVQGIIDCFFKEDDQWVLVDFKTDRIKPQEINEWKEKYRTQMDLYTEALETLTAHKVKEAVLFSIHLNEAVAL